MKHSLLLTILSFLISWTAHAQMMSRGEREIDTTILKLVRSKGLKQIDRTFQDSGLITGETVTSFQLSHDSIWEFKHGFDDIDSNSEWILYDSRNKILSESDTSFRLGIKRYQFFYDSLNRIVKKMQFAAGIMPMFTETYEYRNDSVFSKEYVGDDVEDTSVKVYDKFGNLLLYEIDRVSFPKHSMTVIRHDIYDSRGRILNIGAITFLALTFPHAFEWKHIYSDSNHIEKHWEYRWKDTNWSLFPRRYWEMDSAKNSEIEEFLDSTGTISEIDTTYYNSFHQPVRAIYFYPKDVLTTSVEYHYGSNNEILTIMSRSGDGDIRLTKYQYTY